MIERDQKKAEAKKQEWAEHNRAKAQAKQREKEAHDLAKARAIEGHRQFQAIKGTRDILPPETDLWNRVEQTAREVFVKYGFGEIRLPLLEPTELFARAIGQETDVVSKEMFSFFDPLDQLDLSAQGFDLLLEHLGPKEVARAVSEERSSTSAGFRQALLELRKSTPGTYQPPKPGSGFGKLYARLLEVKPKLEPPKGGQFLSLRPEATASVCRAYIEHGMQHWQPPVRWYYMGPMFRRERPQKGRFRQFYQIGAEVLGGSDKPDVDAEVIEMLIALFAKLGLQGTTLFINSIGHNSDECRRRYVKVLRTELEKVRKYLGKDSQRRVENNPLRVLDSKDETEQEVIEKLPHITNYICDDCLKNYEDVKSELMKRGIVPTENWRLVRGLDYYMRTTFEITAPGLGSQNAICGGGRYDGLVEMLGGPPTKGIGFAIGEDRLILAIQNQGIESTFSPDVLIAWKDAESHTHAQSLAWILRDAGMIVEVPQEPMEPREGLGLANKRGIPIGVVVGPSEVSAGVFSVRLLSDREQVSMSKSQAEQLGRLLVFRVLLEKALRQAAKRTTDIDSQSPIGKLAESLIQRELLPGHLKVPLARALEVLNRAVHGQTVTEEEQSAAVANSLFVLQELSRKRPLEAPLERI